MVKVSGLENISLPPKQKKRGRPKGAEKTVIGLPVAKKAMKKGPLPFLKKQRKDKKRSEFIFCKILVVLIASLMSFSYFGVVC